MKTPILYLSGATHYQIYDELFLKGVIAGGYQAQKFNDTIIHGLSEWASVTALCSLPYTNIVAKEIKLEKDSVRYICVKNTRGKLIRKISKMQEMVAAGKRSIKENRPKYIVCDSITLAASYAALQLGKKYSIPVVAIVTDIPEKMCSGKMDVFGRLSAKMMKRYDGYILLTEAMNTIVNPNNKPYMVMEGACGNLPALPKKNTEKDIILYTGSLWERNAGLEYFIEGFIDAKLPNTELHLYGSGALEDCLKELGKTYPAVKYKGCVTNKEIQEKQAEAALLVNPRPGGQEFCLYSFPSKTFEYFASGTPVLMTRMAGIPSQYYEYAYAIEEETPAGVAKTLRDIFSKSEMERQEKGLKARDFVAKEKNGNIQAERIVKFLSALE